MKQTAVEWLYEELILEGINVPKVFYDKAQEMEKEQIKDAVYYGHLKRWVDGGVENSYAEQYYKETYENNN